jgi:hypothetical protein
VPPDLWEIYTGSNVFAFHSLSEGAEAEGLNSGSGHLDPGSDSENTEGTGMFPGYDWRSALGFYRACRFLVLPTLYQWIEQRRAASLPLRKRTIETSWDGLKEMV